MPAPSEKHPSEIIYQIYPATFYDSNGDGHGDLKGITQKLDYIKSLQVNAIWISPFFLSPEGKRGDGGYAITDYRKIDPRFGTMADFEELLREAHAKHLRVYTDFVLCHTADDHEWFQKSRNRELGFEDFYVWNKGHTDDAGNHYPPNNWKSVFGGSAWTFDGKRGEFYLHHFNDSQPSLNLNSEKVQDAIIGLKGKKGQDDIIGEMDFWLKKGVDGLRLDALPYANYDPQLRDNPVREGCPDPGFWEWQHFKHSMCQPQTVELVAKIRKHLEVTYPGSYRKLIGEIIAGPDGGTKSMEQAAKYLDANTGLHSCYTEGLLQFDQYPDQRKTDDRPPGIERLRNMLRDNVRLSPEGRMGNSFSNHDFVMAASRMTEGAPAELHGTIIRQMLELGAALPGDWFIYQGEELGKRQDDVPEDKRKDLLTGKKSRDGARTPMMWQGGAKNAGFSTSDEPYLPVSEANRARAVDQQHDEPKSVLNYTRELIKMRRHNGVLLLGATKVLDTPDPILAFTRKTESTTALYAFNMSPHTVALRPADYLDAATLAELHLSRDSEMIIGPYSQTSRGLHGKEKNGNGARKDDFARLVGRRPQQAKRVFAADLLIADNHLPAEASAAVIAERGLQSGQKFMIDEGAHQQLTVMGTSNYTLGGSTAATLWTVKKLMGDKADIHLMGLAADDPQGTLVKQTLRDAGIRLLTEQWPDNVRQETAVSHVVRHPSGRASLLTYPATEAEGLRELRAHDPHLLEKYIGESDIVYMPGSFVQKFGLTFAGELLKERWNQHKELVLALPAQAKFGDDDTHLYRKLIGSANVVMGSDEEFCRLYGIDTSRPVSDANMKAVTDKIQEAFREGVLESNRMPHPQEQVAFITRGNQKALLVTAEGPPKAIRVAAKPGDAHSPLGVGDAAFAGFLSGYLHGLSHETSAAVATGLAAQKLGQDDNDRVLHDPVQSLDAAFAAPGMAKMGRAYKLAELSLAVPAVVGR